MTPADHNFRQRAGRIAVQGIGLSLDAYTPDVLELYARLCQTGLSPEYLEIFKAPVSELARVRKALPHMSFAYHGEGLWLTDPALRDQYKWSDQLGMLVSQARAIDALWVNFECASKQFGGYSFGTYLPPIFTRAAADVTAENAELCQRLVDGYYEGTDHPAAPLLLIELPPLTYFAFGDVCVSKFFRRLAEVAACGFVLDIGHLWTVWRYHERRRFRALDRFLNDFLEGFPLHRVVQIHLAGVASVDSTESPRDVPWWIDAHHAPVPDVLWEMLEQALAHPGLTSLKGIALEVDAKEIPLSIHEFERLKQTTARLKLGSHIPADTAELVGSTRAHGRGEHDKDRTHGSLQLISVYEAYARVVSGQELLESSQLAPFAQETNRDGLDRYTRKYLPAEILAWGGDLEALFPNIWRNLDDRGIQRLEFVRFWFQQPRPDAEPYDFFNIKLQRWAEFVRNVAPDLWQEVIQTVTQLLACHAKINQEPAVAAAFRSRQHSIEVI